MTCIYIYIYIIYTHVFTSTCVHYIVSYQNMSSVLEDNDSSLTG